MSFCATPNNLECRVQSSECYEFRILVGELIRNHFAFAIWCACYLPLFDVCSRCFAVACIEKCRDSEHREGCSTTIIRNRKKRMRECCTRSTNAPNFQPVFIYIYMQSSVVAIYTYDRMLCCFVITSIDRSILTEKHTER